MLLCFAASKELYACVPLHEIITWCQNQPGNSSGATLLAAALKPDGQSLNATNPEFKHMPRDPL